VNDEVRRLRTEEQAERFYLARRRGGACAACGRELEHDEPIYVERFEDVRGQWPHRVRGPVGIECASDELRNDAMSRDPERCVGCRRPMYFGVESVRRRRTTCSQPCRNRAIKLRQAEG